MIVYTFPGCSKNPDDASTEHLQESDPIKLRPGLEIQLSQKVLWVNENGSISSGTGIRSLTIEGASAAEGLSFLWNLSVNSNLFPSLIASTPLPTSSAENKMFSQELTWTGKITLADTIDAKQIALPLFWPSGELFLSNHSAIWTSDLSFEELQKNKKIKINPGLFGNALLGPVQEIKLFRWLLENLNRNVEDNPKKEAEWIDVKLVTQKNFALKVNGVEKKVPVLEVESKFARYQILAEAQNPLILEFTLAPRMSAAQLIFSPLLLLKNFVDYRVTEIKQL